MCIFTLGFLKGQSKGLKESDFQKSSVDLFALPNFFVFIKAAEHLHAPDSHHMLHSASMTPSLLLSLLSLVHYKSFFARRAGQNVHSCLHHSPRILYDGYITKSMDGTWSYGRKHTEANWSTSSCLAMITFLHNLSWEFLRNKFYYITYMYGCVVYANVIIYFKIHLLRYDKSIVFFNFFIC